ncbi:MAG: transglycosylase SLT domain-containing protein [Chlorobi bacterium]|nr:transglycosylase SLT domain-containing protein [Chlorobiota bacterium]
MNVNLKSLKIENLLKIPVILVVLIVIVVIITVITRISEIGTTTIGTQSSNPESVIPPVETNPGKKQEDYLKIISYNNAINIENAFYNWQNVFDIFAYNLNDTIFKTSDSITRYEKLSRIIRNPYRKFYRGNSDQIIEEYGSVILEECEYYKLDWRLILAMMKQESAFTPDAVSHAGAYGFMQIMPRTGSMLERTLQLEDHRSPVNNLKAGIYYYAMLVGRYYDAGDTNKYKFALAAYNAGSGHVEDAMSLAYYHNDDYFDWDIVKEYMKLLAPGNDSLHRKVWGSSPPNRVFANWRESYYYVENIMWYWQQYKKIYPLPEDTQKPKKKKKRK